MFFVGLGHSHVVALAKGAYALQAQGAMVAGDTFAAVFTTSTTPDTSRPSSRNGANSDLTAA